ncbi:MAG: dockerin type I domain-containing protein [Acidobacteriota bacterium]
MADVARRRWSPAHLGVVAAVCLLGCLARAGEPVSEKEALICRTTAVDGTAPVFEHLAARASLLPPPEPLFLADASGGSLSPLEQVLGPDGDIESGTVIDMGGVEVLMDDGSSVFGNFLAGFQLDLVRLSRLYYGFRPDDVDVLSFFPDFDHMNGSLQVLVRNDVQGINRPLADNTAIYGSAGRLESVLLFSNFNTLPADPAERIPGDPNTFLSLMAHEFGHQFGAFVRFDSDPGPGVQPSTALLGRSQTHWCFFLDTSSAFSFPQGSGLGQSSLEGNRWQMQLDGTFRTAGITDGYSPLDLYLMGLMAPEDVPPFFLIETATGAGCETQPVSVPHQAAVTVAGTRRDVTVDDIIRVEGPRLPGLDTSQKLFRQAMIVVARAGRFPSPAEIAQVDRLRRAWEPYFSQATGGRATVDTSVVPTPGPGRTFAFVRFPDALQVDHPAQFGLLALDAEGRLATGYTGTVRFSSSDTGAQLPADVAFAASDRGYRLVQEPVIFSAGGAQSVTATDLNDASITGTRSNLPVEGRTLILCLPGPADPTVTTTRPWGLGQAFGTLGGVRFQYLIRADAIGRPALITGLDWIVFGGPDQSQWESLSVKMAEKPEYRLRVSAGEPDLDLNLIQTRNLRTVISKSLDQAGLQAAGRLHLELNEGYSYEGLGHLLIEVRYRGGGPGGILTDLIPNGGDLLALERLGPNSPVTVRQSSTICLGIRPPSGVLPIISDIQLLDVRNQTVTVSWRTSPATDGRLFYGEAGGPLDRISATDGFSLAHEIALGGLDPDTDYEIQIVSRDIDNQTSVGGPVPFRTTRFIPEISGISPGTLRQGVLNTLVRVQGLYFFPGVTVDFVAADAQASDPPQPDPDIRVVASSLVSENLLDLAVEVASAAEPGPRKLHLVNADGFGTLSSMFLGVEPPLEATDIDASGRVDGFDLALLARAFGATFPDLRYEAAVDLDGSGAIDGIDVARLADRFGQHMLP